MEAVDGTGITGAAIAKLDLPIGYAIRLPMGSDCGVLYAGFKKLVLETTSKMDEVCKSTDFEDAAESKYTSTLPG